MWTSRIAAAAFAVSAILGVAQAPMARAQQSAQDGEALITNGEKLLSEGKYAVAVQQFSRAMRSESLTSEQVALAFFQRGKANQELGNHAFAIADFTSALWIKGLPAAQQKQAEEARAQSYASLGQQNRGDTIVAQGGSSNSAPAISAFETRVEPQAAPSAPPARTQVASAKPTSTTDSVGAFQTSVETAEPEAPAESQPGLFARLRASITSSETPASEPETTAALPAPSQSPQPARPEPQPSWSTSTSAAPNPPAQTASAAPARPAPQPSWSTSTSAAPSPPARTASAAPEPQPEAQPEQESSSRVGRFFSGLRGSLRRDEPSPAPETTASTSAAPAAAGSWNASTTVGGGASQPQAASAGGRSYRLQLASVRSEEDAQKTWAQISGQHQDLVGGRRPVIEKTDLGSLGTVYRVQIGPFADKRESLQLCNAFKAGGVDCFLVTR